MILLGCGQRPHWFKNTQTTCHSGLFRVVQYRSSIQTDLREKTGMTILGVVFSERRNTLIQARFMRFLFPTVICTRRLPSEVPGEAQALREIPLTPIMRPIVARGPAASRDHVIIGNWPGFKPCFQVSESIIRRYDYRYKVFK